ncbi:transcriptional regulator PadR family protein [Natrinema sp. J7-2]|nr:transcriptional regulator PadR family protein [Natrinema sp. J7-2]
MSNENSGVKNDYPTDRRIAGRSDGQKTTADAAEDSSPESSTGSHRPSSKKVTLPDGGRVSLSKADTHELRRELTKFQTRILEILAEDSRYGLAIKSELEDYYGVDVNHGRLYPNLDELCDLELVEKSKLDKRTNNYAITETARAFLEDDLGWQDERVNGGDSR